MWNAYGCNNICILAFRLWDSYYNSFYVLDNQKNIKWTEEARHITGGLAIVGRDGTHISTLGTLLNFGSSSTERNRTAGILTQLYIFIQRQTAKRDPTQNPTIAKPCSL